MHATAARACSPPSDPNIPPGLCPTGTPTGPAQELAALGVVLAQAFSEDDAQWLGGAPRPVA